MEFDNSPMTASIFVPFCWLPGSLGQTFELDYAWASPSQIRTMKEISDRPDFAYFVTAVTGTTDTIASPVLMWHTKNGEFRSMSFEGGTVLKPEWLVGKSAPASLNSTVYSVRMPEGWEPINLSAEPELLRNCNQGDVVVIDNRNFVVNVLDPSTNVWLTTVETSHINYDDGGCADYPYEHIRETATRTISRRGHAMADVDEFIQMLRNKEYYVG